MRFFLCIAKSNHSSVGKEDLATEVDKHLLNMLTLRNQEKDVCF